MAGTGTGAHEASPEGVSQGWRYRPEIDGLRSIAVLSVFLFHLDRTWLRGGFVGVDIFFVISGFLICGILRSDIDKSVFSLVRFYQRRIARIAPAFFVVVLATLLAGWLIYSQQDFASLGVTAATAAASIINIKLMVQGNYFQISPDAQPLLHYWSLAVEEQFYLFFPPLLYAVVRWTRRPVVWMGLLGAISFAACVVMTWRAPVPAFYLLPTRAWELLAGACAALLLRQGFVAPSAPASVAGWIGAGLLLASFIFIAEGAQFPGAIAALPVVGTLAIFTAIEFAPASSWLRRLLSHPAALFVGKRSYSLYLWHWPIFSFVDYASTILRFWSGSA